MQLHADSKPKMAEQKTSSIASTYSPSQKSVKRTTQNERGSFANSCKSTTSSTEMMTMGDSSSTLGLNVAGLHLADERQRDHVSSEAAIVVVDIPTIGACVGVDIFSDGSLRKFAEECVETLPSDEERRSQHLSKK